MTVDPDSGSGKGQNRYLPDIAKKTNDIIQSDDAVGGNMAQLSKPVKPVNPSKIQKAQKPLG